MRRHKLEGQLSVFMRSFTIEQGTNTLLPFDLNAIQICIEEVLQGKYKKGVIPKYWDGKST